MLVGPFYVCHLEKDEDIISTIKEKGLSSLSTLSWDDECNSCRTESCSINNGFATEKRRIFIDTDNNKVIDSD